MEIEKKFLFSRKHKGEKYNFFLCEDFERKYIMVEAPDNGWGYSDIYILGFDFFNNAYIDSLYEQYRPKYIIKRLIKQMIAATNKYCR